MRGVSLRSSRSRSAGRRVRRGCRRSRERSGTRCWRCRGDLSSRPSARLFIVDHAEDGAAAVAGAVWADCGGVDEQFVAVAVGVEAATGGVGLRRFAPQPMALLPVSRLLVRTKLAYSPLTAAAGARVAAEGVAGQVDRRVHVPAAGAYGPAAMWIRGAGACWGGAFLAFAARCFRAAPPFRGSAWQPYFPSAFVTSGDLVTSM